jgi:hypothetical protein
MDLSNLVSTAIHILPYTLPLFLFALVDIVNVVRSKFIRHTDITNHPDHLHDDDFTLLVPIYGDIKYLRNLAYLKKYAKHVVLCTTNRESQKFYDELEAIASKHEFRIFRSAIKFARERNRPNPWKIYGTTLHKVDVSDQILLKDVREEILLDSFEVVNTKYVIFIDADTTTERDLKNLVYIFNERNYDIASVRVLPSETKTVMEKLQNIEYQLAMDCRKIYPWLTSGAGMIAKSSVMRNIMHHHSFFFNGGDIEIGKIATVLKYHVGHIPFVFRTDVPPSFRGWFRQRIAWCGGAFRHAIVNMVNQAWRSPFMFFYMTVLVYFLLPIRVYEIIVFPWILLILAVIYWILLLAIHWREFSWTFFLFPLYAFIQVMIIIPIGMIYYFVMVWETRNWGLIRVRHKERSIDKKDFNSAVHFIENMVGLTFVVLSIIAVVWYSGTRIQQISERQAEIEQTTSN